MKYFITGLPRSRTSWISNFMTYGNSFCFHDMSKNFLIDGNILELINKLNSTNTEYSGNCDSGLFTIADRLIAEYPHSKIVIVKRDPNKVLNSLCKSFPQFNRYFHQNIVDITLDKLTILENNYDCKIIDYNELDKEDTCRELWEYCVDTNFNSERWKMLNELKIEPEMSKYLKEAVWVQ